MRRVKGPAHLFYFFGDSISDRVLIRGVLKELQLIVVDLPRLDGNLTVKKFVFLFDKINFLLHMCELLGRIQLWFGCEQ